MQLIAPFSKIDTILIRSLWSLTSASRHLRSQLMCLLGPLATLFPSWIGMDPKRMIMFPTSVILAQPLLSVGVWSALGTLLQLLQGWARSRLTQRRLQAASMLMVAGPLAACGVTSHILIRSVDTCELTSDMQ